MEKDPIVNNVLFISNIPKKIEESELRTLLQPYGTVLSITIIHKPDFAYAFAEFDDMRDAAHALKDLNHMQFRGMNLTVQYKCGKPRENRKPSRKSSVEK